MILPFTLSILLQKNTSRCIRVYVSTYLPKVTFIANMIRFLSHGIIFAIAVLHIFLLIYLLIPYFQRNNYSLLSEFSGNIPPIHHEKLGNNGSIDNINIIITFINIFLHLHVLYTDLVN